MQSLLWFVAHYPQQCIHIKCCYRVLQQAAARINGDRVAQELLQNGNRFGRQHVVFHSKHAYPTYAVRYRMLSSMAAAMLPVIRAECSAQCVSITIAGKQIYKAKPQIVFAIVVVNLNTLVAAKATIFNIHEVSGGEDMIEFITALGKDDIAVVVGPNHSVPSHRSQIVIDVLRSLRSVGGSLHMLECPYVLVGAKHPYVLNGLVHEDHQPGKAAVAVDMRVIRHNRNTVTLKTQKPESVDADDMLPVCWQFQDNDTPHGAMWKDIRGWHTHLTEAYKDKRAQMTMDTYAVNLSTMKMGRYKIRCLNWKGETLSPL